MASCIQERIVAWVKTKLEELVTSEDLVAVERPARGGMPTRPRHRLAVLYQDNPERIEGTHGALYWIQPLMIAIYVRPADGSTDAVDTAVNDLRATVEKQLMADPTCGGLAHTATIREPFGFLQGDAFEGTIVNLDVQFGTLESDPFTQV